MDPKKQNLTPELKQIYDRVMNTQVAAKPGASNPPTAQNSTQQPPTAQQSTQAQTGAPPQTPNNPAPTATAPAQNPTAPAAPATPQPSTANNTGFLSSVPPRPVADNKAFVFTGKKVEAKEEKGTQHAPQAKTGTVVAGGKKISMPIIAALVVVLIFVWGLFWAKLLGLV